MLCENCGAVINDGDMFCGECGFAVNVCNGEAALLKCTNCGSPLQEDAVFCGECGTPVKKTESFLHEESGKNCPYCGAVCASDSEFCGECGKSLSTYNSEKTNPTHETESEVKSVISSVPPYESVSGVMKSTMKTADKPIDYKEAAEKEQGSSFFEIPGDLE